MYSIGLVLEQLGFLVRAGKQRLLLVLGLFMHPPSAGVFWSRPSVCLFFRNLFFTVYS